MARNIEMLLMGLVETENTLSLDSAKGTCQLAMIMNQGSENGDSEQDISGPENLTEDMPGVIVWRGI